MTLKTGIASVDEPTQRIAWKAQERLHKRYTSLLFKGKQSVKAATAIAREMLGFIWDIGRRAEQRMAVKNQIPQT